MEAFLIEDEVDLFYLTGLSLSAGSLLVFPKRAELYVDGRYLQMCKEKSPTAVLALSEKMGKGLKKVGFDSAKMSYDRAEKLKRRISLKAHSHPLRDLRVIKDASELRKMKKAAEIAWKGFGHLQRCLKVGISEKEIAIHFETFCLKHGEEGFSFEPILALGKNSATPHHRASETKLKKGDLVLCDIGVVFEKYRSDMTRVLYFGKVDPRLIQMESVVRLAHQAALGLCKPGTKLIELDRAARKVMRKAKMEELFVHGLGHGIGLETHEFPRISYIGEDKDLSLKEGMVITFEPGLYVPGLGGVRHEETVVITAKGYNNFYV